MPETIPDLTPPLRTDYQSPFVILRMQAGFLKRKTGGILDALVETTEADGGVQVTFDVQAPALNQRSRVLTVTYTSGGLPYPARVEALGFKGSVSGGGTLSLTVSDEEGFLSVLGQVFQSPEVNTLFQSLIAKTNEKSTPSPLNPPAVPPSPFRPLSRENPSNRGQDDTGQKS